jgi:hypothetical protein
MDIGTLIISGVFSVVFAVLTYLAVNKIGEWQKRQMYSKLGVAIIEYLQEEIQTGISLMKQALEAAKNKNIRALSTSPLPIESWEGMPTIPDEVLLRIIETSKDQPRVGPFELRHCRSECKNYFKHISHNYSVHVANSITLAENGFDWSTPLI